MLGDTATRTRGPNRLGHTLDVVETVCALVSANDDPRQDSPVQLWLDEPNAAAVLGTPPYPDGVVVLDCDGDHPTCWLVFVVTSKARVRWLRSTAVRVDEAVLARIWVSLLTELQNDGLDAPARALASDQAPAIRDLARSSGGRSGLLSVGSEPWIRLLGEGGTEDLEGLAANNQPRARMP